MADLAISENIVGERVCNPTRPEWGQGTVLRVQTTTAGGQTVHRVSVQFATGHRTMVIPPGRLALPTDEPQRAAGWLDTLAKKTLDDQLCSLPEAIREFLGTSAQRLIVLARLYEVAEDAGALLKWARSQTGVADPLAHWTRDEIRAAFGEFCRRRDTMLRDAVAAVRSTSGWQGVEEALEDVPPEPRERMLGIIKLGGKVGTWEE
jgi:hypothetical protein